MAPSGHCGGAANALSTLITVPGGARLWYSDEDVAFLQDDRTDEAAIRNKDSQTILFLVDSGYTPDSVVKAITSGDFTLLEHTGLISSRLQKPGPAVPAGGSTQADPTLPGYEQPEPPELGESSQPPAPAAPAATGATGATGAGS